MQFLSKDNAKYSEEGHRIIDAFIKSCWQQESNAYVNLNYNELKRNPKIKSLLLREQHGYCCYCMRKISEKKVTLEHVMPQNIKEEKSKLEEEKEHYFQYISAQNVVYQPECEINRRNKLKYPPYPHSIAYENLTASCDGSIYEGGNKYSLHKCCNNKRGNSRIIPLFFLPRIHYILIYEEDGRLTYPNEYDDTIKALNLDCDCLRLIRKVWACIRRKNINMSEVKSAENDENKRKDILVRLELKRSEEQKMANELYWKLLSQFYWFLQYFGLKYL